MTYRDAGEARAKSEHVYAPREDAHSGTPLLASLKAFAFGMLGAIGAGAVWGPNGAGLGTIGAMALAVVAYRRVRRIPAIVLRAGGGELEVIDGRNVRVRVRLAQLDDVGLESSTIDLVKKDDGESYRLMAGGSDLDLSRIVLVLEPPAVAIPLTERFVAHANSVEERAKIRAFLRREGWVPVDERDAEA